MANAKIYEMITQSIIDKLEQGIVPWRKTWQAGMSPRSLTSKRPYRGVNHFLLSMSGFESPFWATFNQIKKQGGTIKKGEKGTVIVFWKWLKEKKDGVETGETIPLLRYFRVWNTDQTEGLKVPEWETVKPIDFNPILEAEKVVENMPQRPEIFHAGTAAFYRSKDDTVTMPKADTFESPEAYYGTLFHELAHSTGHESRLNRNEIGDGSGFGSKSYSLEELVAEMTTAMICGTIGVGTELIDNQAAYIQGWLKKFRDDKKILVKAGGRAQKAADWILNETPEQAD
jgi:antirestriction protein ArdC